MFRHCSIAVVIPALNEADKIGAMLETIPAYVDRIVLVDDGSRDGTADVARQAASRLNLGGRLEIVTHDQNRGVGAAIASGYRRALGRQMDVVAVMAGDGQMDPADLPRLLAPVVAGSADYAKGNRLGWPAGWRQFPLVRLGGTFALSWLTRVATGYADLLDTQCGYTAASRTALVAICPDRMYPRYGYPNDLLARLADIGARVVDVPVRPVYGPGWRSGLRPARVVVPLTQILLRAFGRRLLRRRRPPPCLATEPP